MKKHCSPKSKIPENNITEVKIKGIIFTSKPMHLDLTSTKKFDTKYDTVPL